jgi:hypothetical protein
MAKVKLGRPRILPLDEGAARDFNVRVVYLDGQEIGNLWGITENPGLPTRPTSYEYIGHDGRKWTEPRLEEARRRIETDAS